VTTARNPRSPLLPRRPPSTLAWALCALGTLLGLTGHAQAQAREFQAARDAYEAGDYARVVELLEPLAGGEVPGEVVVISDPILMRESRKYLGAAYVLTGDTRRGRAQLEALLRAEGEDFERYRLDPAAFPSAVHRVFDQVRSELVAEAAAAEAVRERDRQQRAQERRDAMLTLVQMAQEPTVEVQNDPLLAWVPFGAGQFQNGNDGLGLFFAIGEGISLAGNVALAATWLPLYTQYEASLRFEAPEVSQSLLVGLWATNLVLGIVFVVLAVAGIIEAHVDFVPTRTRRQLRTLPPDVLQQLELVGTPGGIGLRF
jgi:hypothetical protein